MTKPSSHPAPEPFPCDWAALVPLVLHPTRVAIIEALCWVGEPLSAVDLSRLFDDEQLGTSYLSYHLSELGKSGVLVQVAAQQVRGATKKSYFFPLSK